MKITYSKSFIDFLKKNECKISKVLLRLNEKRYSPLSLTDEINYITFRGDGTISYLPKGKECFVSDNGDWKREGRQNGKPAKVIRKLFCERLQRYFKDSDFECFANNYKAEFNDDGYYFKMLQNKEIPEVYEMDRKPGDGSINNSCMNGDSEYLDIYKYCPSLQILILVNKDDELCGRALVWNIKDNETDIVLMDRIYVSDDFIYAKFLSYAVANKMWRKDSYKTYDYKENFVSLQGDILNKQFTIQTDTVHDSYPYIDTFQYGGDGYLCNFHCGDYTYNNTDGKRDGDENEEDDHEDDIYIEYGERRYIGGWYHVDDCVCVNDNWYHQDDSTIVLIGDEYYTKDDDNVVEINDEYYLSDDCTYCERDSCYYLSDDCVYCEDDEEDILRDEAIEINDKWYHKESDLVFENDGKYYLESEGVEA